MRLKFILTAWFGILLSGIACAQFTIQGEAKIAIKYGGTEIPKNFILKIVKLSEAMLKFSDEEDEYLKLLKEGKFDWSSFKENKDQEMFLGCIKGGGYDSALSWVIPGSRAFSICKKILEGKEIGEVKNTVFEHIAQISFMSKLIQMLQEAPSSSTEKIRLYKGSPESKYQDDFLKSLYEIEKIIEPHVIKTVLANDSGSFNFSLQDSGIYYIYGTYKIKDSMALWFSRLELDQREKNPKILILQVNDIF